LRCAEAEVSSPPMRTVVLLAVVTTSALAVEPIPIFQGVDTGLLLNGPTLFGDFGGLRSGFAEHGLVVEASYDIDGALHSRDDSADERRFLHQRLAIAGRMDTGTFLGFLGGGTLGVAYQYLSGDDGGQALGVLQRYSSLDDGERSQLSEFWYRQDFFSGAFSIKAGKDDTGHDFAVNTFGRRFLNRAAETDPTFFAMPTRPDPATGAIVALQLEPWALKAGAYDGRAATTGYRTGEHWLHVPDRDVFLIAETGLVWKDGRREHLGEVLVGMWRHTGSFTRFDGSRQERATGYYLQADLSLWREPHAQGQGIDGWVQYGRAEDDLTVAARHIAIGLSWTGLVPGRDADPVGISHSWLQTSRVAGAPTDADERVFEAFYGFQAAGWLEFRPDFQWYVHPGGRADAADAYVGSLRATVIF
jgi:porin